MQKVHIGDHLGLSLTSQFATSKIPILDLSVGT